MSLHHKEAELKRILGNFTRVSVAFSGGLDSTLLLAVCHEVLGENASAITVSSPLLPAVELVAADELASLIGVRHQVVKWDILTNKSVADNPADRCYHCKLALMSHLRQLAAMNETTLIEGTNLDDLAENRPGHRALAELGICSPLLEARLSKADIRTLSQRRGLPTWDKPPFACLASRIPTGTPLTTERLKAVDLAEEALRHAGFKLYRVRHHGALARIEVAPDEFILLQDGLVRERLVQAVKNAGFAFVTLDLAGYQTGSMHNAGQPDENLS
jgi:uncharacterized protein